MLADAVSGKLKMSKLAFPAIEPITIRTSFCLLRIGLYDEKQKKMIGFRC
jgi:hypothetical protein